MAVDMAAGRLDVPMVLQGRLILVQMVRMGSLLSRNWLNGALMGHEKSAKVAKYCKQPILIAISSHKNGAPGRYLSIFKFTASRS
jgi:hypothetical protein